MQSEVAKELIELEKQFWNAMKEKDAVGAMRLTHNPCILTGATGVASIDKQTLGKMMAEGDWKLHDFTLRDVQVQSLGDDVAIIGYKVEEKMTVDGKPLTLEAADASTWVRKDGKWLCALHTESITGDPYGRDRNKTVH